MAHRATRFLALSALVFCIQTTAEAQRRDALQAPACLPAALALVEQQVPHGQALLRQADAGVLQTFSSTLASGCSNLGLTVPSALHEGVHAASGPQRATYRYFISSETVEVPRVRLNPIRAILPLATTALPPSAQYFARHYLGMEIEYELYGILDELNAYTMGLNATVELLSQRALGQVRSERDGPLAMMLFTAQYFQALQQPELIPDANAQHGLQQDRLALGTRSPVGPLLETLLTNAQQALEASCTIEPRRRLELGSEDSNLSAQVRAVLPVLCAQAPTRCAALQQAFQTGFGCKHLAPGGHRPPYIVLDSEGYVLEDPDALLGQGPPATSQVTDSTPPSTPSVPTRTRRRRTR